MLKTYTIPIPNKTINQLYELWINNGFENEEGVDITKDLLNGSEKEINNINLYTIETDPIINSSAILIYTKNNQLISGVGEVCTAINSRGKGFAKDLCMRIVEDYFSIEDSSAIFLGTVNPVARKIYRELGWEQISSSNVMFNSNFKIDFEDFLKNYYKTSIETFISEGNIKMRLSIIPFILSIRNHNQLDLNAEVNLIDTSSGCLSLFNKFNNLKKKNGNWYCYVDDRNKIYGLTSFSTDNSRNIRIDGLFQNDNKEKFSSLVSNLIERLERKNISSIFSEIYEEDDEKMELFLSLGFKEIASVSKIIEKKEINFRKLIY